MEFFKNKFILANLVISLLAILLSAYLAFYFSKNSEFETRAYERNIDVLSSVLEKTYLYSSYFTVDWGALKNESNTAYHCEYPDNENVLKKIKENKNLPEPCPRWEELFNAKTDFHRATTRARILGSSEVIESLLNVESGFDEVFIQYVSQEYYLRSFVDTYEDIMPKRFEDLEKAFNGELSKQRNENDTR